MTARLPTLLPTTLSLCVLAATSGCGSCAGDKKEKAEPEKAASADKVQKKKDKKEARPRVARRDELTISPVAMAIQVGEKAYMWVDGRSGVLANQVDKLTWTDSGFEWPKNNGTQVLAIGGGAWWRPTPSKPGGQPLAGLLEQTTMPPDGYKVSSEMARGGQYRITLTGPDRRLVRVGMFKEAPKATVWLEGKLPEGAKASPKLDRSAGWKVADDGSALNQVPDGATAIAPEAPSDTDLATWTKDLADLRDGTVTVEWKAQYDLDGDGAAEGLLCVAGGRDSNDCYVVDTLGGERAYAGLNLHWSKGSEAPLMFSRPDGGQYIMYAGAQMSSMPGRETQKGESVVNLVWSDGHAWLGETLR